MSTGKKLRLLYADEDREALQPILQALTARGLRISQTGDPGKRDVVLAVLSEKLYAEPQKTEALLSLVGAGAENVLPLQLDKTAIPEDLKKALYTRNIIPAAGRDPEQIAERIAGAVPPAPPILRIRKVNRPTAASRITPSTMARPKRTRLKTFMG